eukprot:m51a1_g12914 hypothetical protein (497) ;mRNA; r:492-2314
MGRVAVSVEGRGLVAVEVPVGATGRHLADALLRDLQLRGWAAEGSAVVQLSAPAGLSLFFYEAYCLPGGRDLARSRALHDAGSLEAPPFFRTLASARGSLAAVVRAPSREDSLSMALVEAQERARRAEADVRDVRVREAEERTRLAQRLREAEERASLAERLREAEERTRLAERLREAEERTSLAERLREAEERTRLALENARELVHQTEARTRAEEELLRRDARQAEENARREQEHTRQAEERARQAEERAREAEERADDLFFPRAVDWTAWWGNGRQPQHEGICFITGSHSVERHHFIPLHAWQDSAGRVVELNKYKDDCRQYHGWAKDTDEGPLLPLRKDLHGAGHTGAEQPQAAAQAHVDEPPLDEGDDWGERAHVTVIARYTDGGREFKCKISNVHRAIANVFVKNFGHLTSGSDGSDDDSDDDDDESEGGYITASITRYGQLGVLDTWLERLRAMPAVPGVPESAMDKEDAETGTAALAGGAAPAPSGNQ